jgi:polysaccharide chain length determinant protein (PEP-CTERM system associated)
MAWRRRWFIVVPFAVGAFGTLVVSSRLPNLYQSETLLQVVPQRVPDSYVQSTVTIRTQDRLGALSQQVMSRTELERLILDFDLYPEERARLPMQVVVARMRAFLQVSIIAGPQAAADAAAFYVRFSYPDPEIAMRVTERLGSLFVDQNALDRGKLAEATVEFLQGQLAQARGLLEVQEGKLEVFRQNHAGQLPSQLQFNMQAIQSAQLQLQAHVEALARDRDRKLMLERLYNDAQSEPPPPATVRFQDPAAEAGQPAGDPENVAGATAQQRLAQTRATLAGLERRLTAEHPDVVRMRRVLKDLEQEAAGELALAGSASIPAAALTPEQRARRDRLQQMRAEVESLDRQIAFKEDEERRLRDVISDYQARIEAVPRVESEWISLSRDYDTQQAAYKDLRSKSEQAKVAADLERLQVGEQFRILDSARVPARPTSPNRLQLNGVGTVGALLFGLVLAALIELRDATFRTEHEVVGVLGLPVIAQVPYVESDTDRRRRRIRQSLTSVTATIALAAGGYLFWTLRLWLYIR